MLTHSEMHDVSRGGTETRSFAVSIHAALPMRVTVGAVWANRVLPDDAGQISAGQICTRQICSIEVGTGQHGPTQIGAG